MTVSVTTFKITGLSPILMNNPESMMGVEGEDKPQTRTKKIDVKKEAEIRAYRLKDKSLFIPSVALKNSLWEGAAYQKINKKEAARAMINAAVLIIEEEVQLLSQKTKKPIKTYEIDTRPVVIKTTKGRILRHRPRVDDWYCLLPLEIDDDFITADIVNQLFNRSGKLIGVMDFRVSCRGQFGRYTSEIYK